MMLIILACDHLRSSVLDLVLRLVEAISVLDNYSQVISSNEELFHLVCRVVKLPDKFEVSMLLEDALLVVYLYLFHDFLIVYFRILMLRSSLFGLHLSSSLRISNIGVLCFSE